MAEAKFAPVCDMEEESGWDDEEWKEQGGAQEVTVPVGPNCDVSKSTVSLALLLFLFRTVGIVHLWTFYLNQLFSIPVPHANVGTVPQIKPEIIMYAISYRHISIKFSQIQQRI